MQIQIISSKAVKNILYTFNKLENSIHSSLGSGSG